MATSRIRRHDSFFRVPEDPMLPQQQPVSSNSASYVLSVSCLFLCGPLRRISVNARFYVLCCLVLWRGGCYGGPLQFPDEIQGQSCVLKKFALLIGFPCLCIQTWCLWWFVDGTNVACLFDLHVCYVYVTVLCSICGESHRSHHNVPNEIHVLLRKRTLDIMDDLKKPRTLLPWRL